MEDALRAIGQTMASMGAKDYRLIGPRQVDYRLKCQLDGYARHDPAPTRVQPAPLALLNHGFAIATSAFDLAVADLAYMAFFFLNRPGEYAKTTSPDPLTLPFCLRDVAFKIGARRLSAVDAPLSDILASTFVLLTFSQQKNGVRGEAIGHGLSGHHFACPVLALQRRVLHLRHHAAPPSTPLYMVFQLPPAPTRMVTAAHITSMLRIAAAAQFRALGVTPAQVSARSLRAGGAMALLCA